VSDLAPVDLNIGQRVWIDGVIPALVAGTVGHRSRHDLRQCVIVEICPDYRIEGTYRNSNEKPTHVSHQLVHAGNLSLKQDASLDIYR
jgi:hypothetical protein